jgi:hypothetical protein
VTPDPPFGPLPASGWTPPVEVTLTAPLACRPRILGAVAEAAPRTYPAGSVLTFDGSSWDGAELQVFLYDHRLGIVIDGATYLAVVDAATARGTLGAARYRALTGRA